MTGNANYIDYGLMGLATTYSLANIEHILGVIILVIQCVWLTIKLGIKLYHYIKNKKPIIEIVDDIEQVIDSVEDVVDKVKKDGDNNEQHTGTK